MKQKRNTTSFSSAASGPSRRPPRSSRCTARPPASTSARCRWRRKADVDAAVAAARAAFDSGPWPSTPPKERAAVIASALKLMEERKELFVSCSPTRPASRR